ncbi:MAG TPA: LPD7 domain-containing protein [Asticcacaulis sp.]|nr:LPD7 domain-containing protein [Asticcacaulis sp.]
MSGEGDKDIDALAASVRERLRETRWEDYDSADPEAREAVHNRVLEIREDLDKINDIDPLRALKVWDENIPDEYEARAGMPDLDAEPKPAENAIEPGRRRRRPEDPVLEADPVEGPTTTRASPSSDQDASPNDQTAPDRNSKSPAVPEIDAIDQRRAERLRLLQEGVEKRYHVAGERYHFRDAKRGVAFEAGDKCMTTRLEDPTVVASMIDLAEARAWTELKLSGSWDFKREAWLQASLRGMEVSGYAPDKLDQARFAEHQSERERAGRNPASPKTGRSRSTEGPRFDEQTRTHEDEPKVDLSPGQKQVISILEKVMTDRGDSSDAIARAREIAAERFVSNRVYVGRLVETGTAPYLDKTVEKPSHYITLEDDAGKRSTVWGVDLPRGLKDANAVVGEKVVVAYGGRRTVSIDRPIKDNDGQVIGSEKAEVTRNSWDVVKFDRIREDAKAGVVKAAQRVERPAMVRVYDRSAPSKASSKTIRSETGRGRERAI